MKKVIVTAAAAVVLAGGAVTGASWYTGKQIEAGAAARLADLNQELGAAFPGYGLVLRLDRYRRGVFSSQARYAVQVGPDGIAGLSERARLLTAGDLANLDVHIDHGPFPTGALAQGHLSPQFMFARGEMPMPDLLRLVVKTPAGAAPLAFDLTLGYGHTAVFSWHTQTLTAAARNKTFRLGGSTGSGRYADASRALNMHVSFDPSSAERLETDPAKMSVEGGSLDIDTHAGPLGLSVGNADLNIARIGVERPGANFSFALTNLHLYSNTRPDSAPDAARLTIGTKAGLDIGTITLGKLNLGAGQIVLKAAQLDAQAYSDFTRKYNLRSDPFHELMMALDSHSETWPDTMVTFNRDIIKVLAGSPVFSIDPLSLSTEKGDIKMSVSLALQTPADAKPDVHVGLRDMLKTVDVNWMISRAALQDLLLKRIHSVDPGNKLQPAEVVPYIDAWSKQFVDAGFATLDGDKLTGKLHYVGGSQTATINGTDMPLGRAAQALFMAPLDMDADGD